MIKENWRNLQVSGCFCYKTASSTFREAFQIWNILSALPSAEVVYSTHCSLSLFPLRLVVLFCTEGRIRTHVRSYIYRFWRPASSTARLLPRLVGKVGLEPTCDQLHFQHRIRVRWYIPIQNPWSESNRHSRFCGPVTNPFIPQGHLVEQVVRIEPASPAWQADALTIVLYLHHCAEHGTRTR